MMRASADNRLVEGLIPSVHTITGIKMDRFKDFVTENVYYHGTTPAVADHILKNGLDPSKSKYGNKLYLTTNHGEAHKYGKIANGNKPGVV